MIGPVFRVTSETVYQLEAGRTCRRSCIEEAEAAAALDDHKLKRQEEAEIVPKYRAAGITVIEDVDREAFRRATASVYDTYPGFTPGLKATVQGLLAK